MELKLKFLKRNPNRWTYLGIRDEWDDKMRILDVELSLGASEMKVKWGLWVLVSESVEGERCLKIRYKEMDMVKCMCV